MKWLFCPLPQGKNWDGTTIYTEPLGGSEASVAYTARALAREGEEVHVLGHMAPDRSNQERVIDEVTYWPQGMLPQLVAQEWDVVISSRWKEILEQVSWNTALRLIWLHDMPYGDWTGYPVHSVIVLTEFHRKAWNIHPDACEIIGDGVDLTLFRGSPERDENKLLWISNPDRGLALAAKIFQEIRKRWPDLELHVYGRGEVYGWGDAQESPFLPRPEHMENIFLHKPVKRSVLAKKLQEAWAVFYPSYWPETFCMATMEAQAAGTPVIAAPLAALNETVEGGILTYDYLNAVSQLRNRKRWEKLSEAGLAKAAENTWSIRAEEWKAHAYMLLEAISDNRQ